MEKKYKVIQPNEGLLVNEPAVAYGNQISNENMVVTSYLKGTVMPYCFTEEELDLFIKNSEKSGWVDDDEIKAFEERWINIG